MRTLILAAAFIAGSAGALCAADSPAMKTYIHMKQDSDLYLGEGLAEKNDFDGNAAMALKAAQSRAKGALAEAIRVRVSSQTTENLQSKDGKVTEEIQSQTQSQADVSIENIKFMEFTDFPETGQMTVLATVTKEDYRRQLAGKAVPVYRIERGLRLQVGTRSMPWVDIIRREVALDPFGPNPCSNCDRTPPGPNPADINFGLEIQYRGWLLGAEMGQYTVNGWFRTKAGTQTYKTGSTAFGLTAVNVGYEWTPWAWRLQPFFPLKLEAAFINYDGNQNLFWGLVPGVGVRYWINDFISLDLKASQHSSFGSESRVPSVLDRNIAVLGALNADGSHFEAGLTWSGF